MDEKRILEQLLASAQEIPVPEGLRPEIMEKRLEQTAQELRAARRSRRQIWQKSLLGAAAVVLCVGLVILGRRGAGSNSSGASMAAMDMASEASGATADAGASEAAAGESEASDDSSASALGGGTYGWEEASNFYTQAGSYKEIREYLQTSGAVQKDAEAGEEGTESSGTGEPKTGEIESVRDKICTDGSRAYMLEGQTLRILTAEDGGAVTTEEIRLAEIQSGEGLMAVYRDGEVLRIAVGTEEETRLLTYDISRQGQPKLQGAVSQEGKYVDSAEWNGSVQLVTKAAITFPETPASTGQSGESEKTESMAEQGEAEQEWMPQINGQDVSAENSYLSVQGGNQAWLFSTVSAENPGTISGSGMILGGNAEVCLKGRNAILQEISYHETGYTTKLAGFELTDEGLLPMGALSLRGIVQDPAWINEQDGYLRVLSESWNDGTGQMEGSIYVLDSGLYPVGILEGLNLEQGVEAVCFDGSRAYLSAAGENGGLLLSLDLWEPSDPALDAELAVDGAFDRLIRWADGRLLCIGRETATDTDGAAGLRLVMYDCPETGLAELHAWSSADVSTNMADEAVWVIGAQEKRVLVSDEETGGYIVISYSEEGFQAEEMF